jgi:hypothetical protein
VSAAKGVVEFILRRRIEPYEVKSGREKTIKLSYRCKCERVENDADRHSPIEFASV